MTHLLTLIVLLPLAGFLLNGLAGNRLGKRFVTVGRLRAADRWPSPLTVKCFLDLHGGGGAPLDRDRLHLGRHRRTARSRSRSTSTASPR